MVKRSRGFLSGKTRQLKSGRKLTVSDQVREYKVGSNVVITLQPRRDGMVAPRYQGRHGKILDKQGAAYIISIKDGNAVKKLVISSIHLKEAAQ